MQIKLFTILLFSMAFPLAGMPADLLPEWRPDAKTLQGKARLPKWRFSDWGKRPAAGKTSGRNNSAVFADGKLLVTLENPEELQSANMFFRTLALKLPHPRLYRLKCVMVNSGAKDALVKLQMTGTGAKSVTARSFHSVGKTPVEKELEVLLPRGTGTLQIAITLLGPGKVTFSDLRLSAEDPPPLTRSLKLSTSALTLPGKTPVEMAITLPEGSKTPGAPNALTVTLPWGVRLISTSSSASIKNVAVKVKKETVTTIVPGTHRYVPSRVLLLLGSDLPPGQSLMGSVKTVIDGSEGEPVYFKIDTVQDVPAVPPRFFKVILPVHENFAPHECASAVDDSRLRCGANVLLGPRLTLSPRQLRTARISHRAYLNLNPAKAEKYCHYEMLRNETFWEKHFIPALRRQILRLGSNNINTLICDKFLGQKRAISCLCNICRMELADFAPKLPVRDVMNLSAGLLSTRYPREVRNFRNSRLAALWAGARLHLPVESRGFRKRPALIPIYTMSQVFSERYEIKAAEAVIDLSCAIVIPDGKKYDPAVNFLTGAEVYRQFRTKISRKTPLTAKITPPLADMTPGELTFDVLNLFFNGFTGVWINLAPGTGYAYHAAVARAALTMREYENFFRRRPLARHSWIFKNSAPALKLPPLPSVGGYRLGVPSAAAPLKLLVWKFGPNTLTAVGNFGAEPLTGTLQLPSAPVKWRGKISGAELTGNDLRTRGVEVTIPPRSWQFFQFQGI